MIPSPFPEHDFTRAFDTLIRVLKADEILSSRVKTWRTFEGKEGDTDPPEPQQMPWIRLTPTLSGVKFATIHDYQDDFAIEVELATEGTDVRHMLNFWGAFVGAMSDQRPFRDTTARQALRDEGNIVTYRIARSGLAPVVEPEGYLYSRAALLLVLHTPA